MLEMRCGVCNAPLLEVEDASHLPQSRELYCRICKTRHIRRGGRYVVAEGQPGEITKGEVSPETVTGLQPPASEAAFTSNDEGKTKPTAKTGKRRSKRRK